MEPLNALVTFLTKIETTLVAAVFATVNLLLMPAPLPWWKKVIEFVLSLSFAYFVGRVCDVSDFGQNITLICTAAAALLARSTLMFVMGLGEYIFDRRNRLYKAAFDFLMRLLTRPSK
jgi:hypothetical protein